MVPARPIFRHERDWAGWLCDRHRAMCVPEPEVMTMGNSFPPEACLFCDEPGSNFVRMSVLNALRAAMEVSNADAAQCTGN